jgi:hypothetical protein
MDCHIKLCFLAPLLSRASHLGPDTFSRKNLCVRGELLEMQPFERKVKKKKKVFENIEQVCAWHYCSGQQEN